MHVKYQKYPSPHLPHLLYTSWIPHPIKESSSPISLSLSKCVYVCVLLMKEIANYNPLTALFFRFLALLFMALLTFPPEPTHDAKKRATTPASKRKKKKQPPPPPPPEKAPSSSWYQFKNLLTCKQIPDSKIHDPSKHHPTAANSSNNIYTSCSSICTFRDVAYSNTRVVHRADISPEGSTLGAAPETRLLSKKTGHHGSSSSSTRSSATRSAAVSCSAARGIQLRKLSGCYECHAIVDPAR